jgi:hypothetical protein
MVRTEVRGAAVTEYFYTFTEAGARRAGAARSSPSDDWPARETPSVASSRPAPRRRRRRRDARRRCVHFRIAREATEPTRGRTGQGAARGARVQPSARATADEARSVFF